MPRYALRHRVCGKPVFYYDEVPVSGDLLLAEKATLPDGTRPVAGEVVGCPFCGRPISMSELDPDYLYEEP